jgi:hypothetical protein
MPNSSFNPNNPESNPIMNDKHSNIIVYFDMDGVLFEYDREDYTGDNPKYLTPGSHCYRDKQPNKRAAEVCKTLYDKGVDVRVLTAVSNIGHIFLEQTKDKIYALNQHYPYIDISTKFIATTIRKDKLIKSLYDYKSLHSGPNFGPNHILIDDYNPNLKDWAFNGGTSLKYCNGLNSPDTFTDGIVLTEDMNSEDIVELISTYLCYTTINNN